MTYEPTSSMILPRVIIQSQLNDLTRDLCLSKENAQLLGSRLSESIFSSKKLPSIGIETEKKSLEGSLKLILLARRHIAVM